MFLSAFACLNTQHKQFFYCLCELKFVWGRVKVRGQGSGGVRVGLGLQLGLEEEKSGSRGNPIM